MTAWVRLLRAHAAITRAFNAQLVADHGLTVNDYEVLLLLSHAPEDRLRRVDLVEAVRLTPSGITRLLEGLQHQGLVERQDCESDARVAWAVLTPAGREKLERAGCSHVRAIRALFGERYDGEQLQQLVELLGRLPGATEGGSSSCTAG